jgi:hypothetical protein
MKLRKAQARLERRLKAFADAKISDKQKTGFHRPGSSKKNAPKGRGMR